MVPGERKTRAVVPDRGGLRFQKAAAVRVVCAVLPGWLVLIYSPALGGETGLWRY